MSDAHSTRLPVWRLLAYAVTSLGACILLGSALQEWWAGSTPDLPVLIGATGWLLFVMADVWLRPTNTGVFVYLVSLFLTILGCATALLTWLAGRF